MSVEIAAVVLLLASAWMAGVGWSMQAVHYPAFLDVAPERWTGFHAMHTRGIGPIVGPPMIAQIFATVALWFVGADLWFAVGSSVLLALSVGWTGTVCGPLHLRICENRDAALVRRLVRSNWLRTFAWTAQAGVAAGALLL